MFHLLPYNFLVQLPQKTSVGVGHVDDALLVPKHMHRIMAARNETLTVVLSVPVKLSDLLHVIPGLRIWRNSGVTQHRSRARVVSRQRQPYVTAEVVQ